ncbi:hypothetical protein [Streptomyces murinus]|uniref:Secreted protein/lipoprotein n=1 Tax=Streptomyces murinus TaxID=33900 RepID=A0A7W3RJ97_STRMR|nr:hypothetical protein [Streptomyces murinus]MBA9050939.1 hypothetical protein [Streptomyces murinus]
MLLLASSVLALAGCSDSSPDTPARPNPAPTAGSPSPRTTAEAAALTAYSNSWAAQTEAYSKASSAATGLNNNTTLRALFDIEHDLKVMRKAGQVMTGKPVIHPKVIKVADGKIPTAVVNDCVDTTHWTLIDKTSKKPVPLPTTRLLKYASTATLEKWGTKWMVTKWTAQERSC